MLEGKEDFFSEAELADKAHLNKEPLDSFYLTVLKKSPSIASEIKGYDEPILKCLKYIDNEVFEDKDDFKLIFHFSENEFFDNTEITVTIILEDKEVSEIKSDTINWKEGKNVTVKTITKK